MCRTNSAGTTPTQLSVDHFVLDYKYSEDWQTLEYRIVWLVNFDAGDWVCHGYIYLQPDDYGPMRDYKLRRFRFRFREKFGPKRYDVRAFTMSVVSSNTDMEHIMRAGVPQFYRGKTR